MLRREDTEEEVDATEAGRGGGAEGVEKLKRDDVVEVGAGISFLVPMVVAGRTFGLGVMDPGVVPGEKRDLMGLWVRFVVLVAALLVVCCRGRPTGVTKLLLLLFVVVPEIVRARGWVTERGEGLLGTMIFSALLRGRNIPDEGVEVEKYRTPATLPSFFP